MRWGVVEGAAFGTAIADDQAFKELAGAAVIINPDVRHYVREAYRGQRIDDLADVFNTSDGAMPTAQLQIPFLKDHAALWFYLMMQGVTENESTPFRKEFAFPASSPDFLAPAGKFITLCGYSPVASTSEKVSSMIGEKFTLSLSPDANEGNLFATLDLKGKGFVRNANPSGAWTPAARDYYSFYDLVSFKIDSGDIVLQSMELSIENTIFPVGFDSSGGFQNYVITKHDVSMNIVGIWDSVMRGGQDDLDAGNEVVITFHWGVDGTDGFLDFALHGVIESAPLLEEDSRKVSLAIKGVSDKAGAPDKILIAKIDDEVDYGW